jgi:hypothetical protein
MIYVVKCPTWGWKEMLAMMTHVLISDGFVMILKENIGILH